MDMVTQTMLNLKREINRFIIPNSVQSTVINSHIDVASCAIKHLSRPTKQCSGCNKLSICAKLTTWNDISDKERMHKA